MLPLCNANANVARIRPFILLISSRSSWLSATISISGKAMMRSVTFFIRDARPIIFFGIRLHIDSHCSSSMSCENSSFSSLLVTSTSFWAVLSSFFFSDWKVTPSPESFSGLPIGDGEAAEADV